MRFLTRPETGEFEVVNGGINTLISTTRSWVNVLGGQKTTIFSIVGQYCVGANTKTLGLCSHSTHGLQSRPFM